MQVTVAGIDTEVKFLIPFDCAETVDSLFRLVMFWLVSPNRNMLETPKVEKIE